VAAHPFRERAATTAQGSWIGPNPKAVASHVLVGSAFSMIRFMQSEH